MSLSRSAKPTKGNIRRRVRILNETAGNLGELTQHWNPKGRYFKVQRDLIQLSKYIEDLTTVALSTLER